MATTKWDIAVRCGSRVKDLDTNLGSPILSQFVEDTAIEIQNFTGQSIDLTNIGSKWFGVLTNGAAAIALGYMNGVGISYSAGRMNIDKQTELDGQEKERMFFMDMYNKGLDSIGRRIEFDKSEPTG